MFKHFVIKGTIGNSFPILLYRFFIEMKLKPKSFDDICIIKYNC